MWQLQSKLQKPGRRSEECFFHYQCRSAWWKIFFAMPNLYFNVKSQPTILSFLFFFSEFLLTQVIVVEASWLNGADFEIIWHQSCHFCYILHRCLGLLIKLHSAWRGFNLDILLAGCCKGYFSPQFWPIKLLVKFYCLPELFWYSLGLEEMDIHTLSCYCPYCTKYQKNT